ncbi:thiamine pyrophosphate-dependent dehydrogenase E1 component subunit alpha [Actinosynnema sp. NPDC023587]|uniref:thiamine pyrophosphate-dependent dehydrogenase E1 component subunit alpha n=1 Tax=Actinosynnema sp. NPDC023587 TaxID=3154695 RepID=UPI0033DA134C
MTSVPATERSATRPRPAPRDEPDPVQLLTPGGLRVEHPDFPLSITGSAIADLYRDMVVVRRIDTQALALARQGELAVWASLAGQEAAQVGSGRALAPGDMAFPTYREHGVAWCRGVDMTEVLGHFRGVYHMGWDPRRHNFHLYSIVIGAHALHATGYAMGVDRDSGTDAVIAYFGDGAMSQGDVNEAFVWASAQHAPVVFFCQNNQYAISEHVRTQSTIPLHRRADGFGFPGVRVDGNDVLACLAVTRKAMDRARAGGGPTLVEAFTYRMGGHTTTDDPTRYRSAGEVEQWRRKDPIARVRAHLSRSRLADRAFFDAVDAEAADIAADLRRRVIALPDPAVETIWDHTYAAAHPVVAAERADHLAYLDAFEDER